MLLVSIIVHFFADMATSIFQPLGPYLTEVFSVSPRSYAMALYTASLISAFAQPIFGFMSDSVSKRNVYLAAVLSITFVSAYSISLVHTLGAFFVLVLLAQLANSAFHPMGAIMATHRRRSDIAYFTLSGMFGYAVGPILITWYAQNYQLAGLEFLGMGLAVFALLMLPRMSFLKVERRKPPKISFKGLWVLLPIFFYVALRSATMGMAQVYGPMYAKLVGLSLVIGGSMLTITRFVGMVLAYSGVHVGERIGYAKINVLSAVLMTVSALIFSMMDFTSYGAPWNLYNLGRNVTFPFLLLFVSMLAPGYLSMSSVTAEAQSRLPSNAAFASSIAMGASWATGSLINLVFSSIFGNDVKFVVSSIWMFAALSLAFAVWDLLWETRARTS